MENVFVAPEVTGVDKQDDFHTWRPSFDGNTRGIPPTSANRRSLKSISFKIDRLSLRARPISSMHLLNVPSSSADLVGPRFRLPASQDRNHICSANVSLARFHPREERLRAGRDPASEKQGPGCLPAVRLTI